MLIDFFLKLKSHKLPVSIKEYLTLLEAMGKDVIGPSIDEFYYLSRASLVKDEANFDKFDRAFGEATFEQVGDKVRVIVFAQGLKPGAEHGFHIHEACLLYTSPSPRDS